MIFLDKNSIHLINDKEDIRRDEKIFEKNISSNINNFKLNRVRYSYSIEKIFNDKNNKNYNNFTETKNIVNSNSNIYIRNNKMNLNIFEQTRLNKIYKEDSFYSKKNN